jgi:copper chaperone
MYPMVNLSIPDMSCGHCKTAVTEALTSVSGVTKVEVDLDGRTALVEGNAALAALVRALDQAGYPATLAE